LKDTMNHPYLPVPCYALTNKLSQSAKPSQMQEWMDDYNSGMGQTFDTIPLGTCGRAAVFVIYFTGYALPASSNPFNATMSMKQQVTLSQTLGQMCHLIQLSNERQMSLSTRH
jgi:hypothetical protein